MNKISIHEKQFKNIDSPFTELFSLLKRYENSCAGIPTLAYNSDELKVMHAHIDNAVDVLLQGLQDMGNLLGMALPAERISQELNNIGFFISAVSNLTEALNALRSDTDYVLRKRGVMSY